MAVAMDQTEPMEADYNAKPKRTKRVYAPRHKDPLDNKKSLDLVLIIECTTNLSKFTEIVRKHYKYFIKSSRRERKMLRVSLVKYWDHPAEVGQAADLIGNVEIHDFASTDEEIKKMFDSAICTSELEKGKRSWPSYSTSVQGGHRGLANALYKVSNLTFRRDANKVCILLAASTHRVEKHGDKSDQLHRYTSPQANHDVVNLTRLLASRGLSLHVIGCVPHNVPLRKHLTPPPIPLTPAGNKKKLLFDVATAFQEPRQFEDDGHFLEAMAHISGGRYIPIFSSNSLTKIISHLIEEDIALENLMGIVNDEVTIEVGRQFGDANAFHLARTLCEKFGTRKVKCLQLNSDPITPTCELSERLSWAPNFVELQEINKATHSVCSYYKRSVPHPIFNVTHIGFTTESLSEDVAMRLVRRLLCRMPQNDQEVCKGVWQ